VQAVLDPRAGLRVELRYPGVPLDLRDPNLQAEVPRLFKQAVQALAKQLLAFAKATD
jgi:hypothetical protein